MDKHRELDEDLVKVYLSDHAAGAAAITRRLRRMAGADSSELASEMGELANTLERERTWILNLMQSRSIAPSRWKSAASMVAETVGRLKLNGHLVRTSPLSPLLELELLASGLRGKRSGWRTLREWSAELAVDGDQLDRFLADVDRQIERVEELLVEQRPTALQVR